VPNVDQESIESVVGPVGAVGTDLERVSLALSDSLARFSFESNFTRAGKRVGRRVYVSDADTLAYLQRIQLSGIQ